ncbi:hypothetical protein COCON_G00011500 [Conger conger]|uniref:Uncharacterized protein n=1 Tax=Conger conger TaxID=82655 RepID=A0A9Q1E2I5_CONCO|nr:hypothetical protein COCON_G00011500 [Conger conger]
MASRTTRTRFSFRFSHTSALSLREDTEKNNNSQMSFDIIPLGAGRSRGGQIQTGSTLRTLCTSVGMHYLNCTSTALCLEKCQDDVKEVWDKKKERKKKTCRGVNKMEETWNDIKDSEGAGLLMSHQRHWGGLAAVPGRVVPPVPVHICCGGRTQERTVEEEVRTGQTHRVLASGHRHTKSHMLCIHTLKLTCTFTQNELR